MERSQQRWGFAPRLWAVVVLALLLAGCKVELYSGLSEQEANEMLALLLEGGIDSGKQPGKERTASLLVEERSVARAVDLLRANGYPKDRYDSLGNVFKKEGLISSPLEERIRYIYALSQEVSETLSKIDGVIVARVHIVLPENQPFDEHVKPSAAAVFIKHRPEVSLERTIPQVKMIVNHAIEGLTYDKISVALFPARTEPERGSRDPLYTQVMGVRLAPESQPLFWGLIGGAAFLLLVALAANGFQFWRARKMAPPPNGNG